MVKAADAFVEFHGDFSKVQAGAAAQGKTLEKSFSSNFKNIAKGAALSFAAIGGARLLKGAFAQAEEAAKVARQTDAVIKSTGAAANVSAGHVDTLANKLSGVAAIDDEIIKSGENVLLTFTNIRNVAGRGNDIFDQATQSAVNLSAALGTDLQGSVIQIGKALNDPIKGITALQRVGVSFTKKQREQVKALVDSGKALDAQKLILKELNTEFGGAAAAAATPTQKLKVAFENLEESLGKVLVPLVNGFVPVMTFLATHPEAAAAVLALAVAFGAMVIVTKIIEAVRAFQAAMVGLNVVMAANPVLLVAAAIAALGVGLFIAYKKVKPFHDAIDKLWQLLQATFHWIQRNWPLLLAILTGPFGLAVLAITRNWNKIKEGASAVKTWIFTKFGEIITFFKGLPGKIGGVLSGLAGILTAPYRAAFNAIARLWNNTIGKLSFKIPGWVPGLGGKGFDVPNIPTLHTGGVVNFGSMNEGLAFLKSGEGVFTKAQMKALGTGGQTIDAHIEVHGNVIDFDDLNRFADERDHKLVMALGAGAR